jgi:hypothetical protein
MKKKILLIGAGAAGAAAGLLYALETNWRKQKSDANNETTDSASTGNGKAQGAQLANRNNQDEAPKRSASGARIEETKTSDRGPEPEIDDLGTGQSEASRILQDIRDTAFEASNEKLALALGRPTEEIEEWTNGHGPIDGDVVMKARTLAIQRGLEVE